MTDHRTVAPDEDPVCGMTVDLAQARAKGLVTTYEGHEYGFCGKGCSSSSATTPRPSWRSPTPPPCSGVAPPKGPRKM